MFRENFAVYCLKYAESVLPESMAFFGASKEKIIPISFAVYLIKTKDKNILVDAGCDTMPKFVMKKFYSPAFVLRQAELSSDEITDVIITHAHHDHIEAVKHFKNATIYISKSEYENIKGDILKDFNVSTFDDTFIIDSGIKIIKQGGHSKGSSIVEIQTEDSIHILAGDECYTNANIENKICTGTFYNKEKAIEFVKKYSDKKYRVHTCHEISLKTEMII